MSIETKIKGATAYQWAKFILFVLIVIWVIWFLNTCNKKVVEPIPVKPSAEIVQEKIDIQAILKKQDDSFKLVFNKLDKFNDKQYQEYLEALNKISELEANKDIALLPVPDTCTALNLAWVSKYNQYVKQSNNATQAANRTISGLNNTIGIQKKYLSTKDTALKQIGILLDTCTKGYAQLEKNVKAVSPKRELSFGISGMGNYAGNLNPAAGVVIAYRNKRGFEIQIAGYTNQVATLTLKKPLFKF